MSRSQEVAEASARRMAIVDELLNLLTSDAISTKELQRLRFVGEIFGIKQVVDELCSSASTREGRCELSLACAMCALNIALDDTPPASSERVLKRREADKERREAAKEFKASLAGKVAVKPGKPSAQAFTIAPERR